MPSLDSGSSTGTHRSSPNQTSIGPTARSTPASASYARRGGARRPDSAIDAGASAATSVGERGGDVVDHPDLTVHGGHDTEVERDTVAVYEARAEEWRDRRRAAVPRPGPCARGGHAGRSGERRPRLRRRRSTCRTWRGRSSRSTPPTRWCGSPARPRPTRGRCRPTSRRSRSGASALGAAWARASYLHVPNERLPAALADLHRALAVGAPVHLVLRAGRDRRRASPTTTSRVGGSRGGPRTRWPTSLVGAGFDVDACAVDRRRAVLARGPRRPRPHAWPTPSGPGCACSCAA